MYAASFLSGMIGSGGDLKAGLISMASAGLAKYIGHGTFSAAAKGGASPFGAFKPIAHGVSQGAMTKLRGGRFKDGFLGAIIAPIAGGLTKNVLSSTFNTTNVTMQKIIAITAGGVGAKAAGGSFQSGAMSAAFVYLFNDHGAPHSKELNNAEHKSASDLHMSISEKGGLGTIDPTVKGVGKTLLKNITEPFFKDVFGVEINTPYHSQYNQDYDYLENYYNSHRNDNYAHECIRCHERLDLWNKNNQLPDNF